MPSVRLTAVADANKELASDVAARTGAAAFHSAEALLCAELVDAVSLCTPDDLHFHDARAVITADKHLLLEKPIATTIEEAERLVDLSELSSSVVMPGHTLRFDSKYVTAHNLYASGQLGAVVHGYARRNNRITVADRVKGRTSVAFFLGIHDLDALTWIVGERIVSVQALESGRMTGAGRRLAMCCPLVIRDRSRFRGTATRSA